MKIQYITNVRMPTEKAHGIQIAKACEAFARKGHEVTLMVPKRHNPITESPFTYYGVERNFTIRTIAALDTVRWGKIGFLIQTISFACSVLFIANKKELIYGRDERVLAVLLFFGAKKVVWESHDAVWGRVAAYVVKRARAVVVVTQSAKDFYTEQGVAEEQILNIPNGVDLAAFAHSETKEVAQARLGIPQDKKIVLYIGRLDGWKGSETLLEASTQLSDTIRVVIIGGESAQLAHVEARYPHVIFLGYRPYRELAHNQAAADVLVVPNTAKDKTSVRFTSPLKLLAHLASGRPVIASDLPALRELGGEAVLYVPPDSPQALGAAIERLLQDETLAGRLVEEAGKRVSGYDWGIRAERILSFITPRL